MDLNKVYIIDIETNGLMGDLLSYKSFPYRLREDARVWCVVIRCLGSDEVYTAVGDEVCSDFFERTLVNAEVVVAHNGIKFDFIMLKLFGLLDYRIGYFGQPDILFGKEVRFLDSLIMSRLFNPDRYGGHSLDSWGERVGSPKMDYRGRLIELEALEPNAPKGHEFTFYHPLMLDYCIQDTKTNALAFLKLLEEEYNTYDWREPLQQEHILADYAIRRETLGFKFDKELALWCLDDLTEKMNKLAEEVNPLIPDKPLGKTALKNYTPPKNQFKKDGTLAAAVPRFVERIQAELIYDEHNNTFIRFEGKDFMLPYHEPLKTTEVATIDDLDTVKHHLIDLGWEPSEWRERDITKDSKKQNLSYEKRIEVLNRWIQSARDGKYRKHKEEYIKENYGATLDTLPFILEDKLQQTWPIRLITSPSIRTGVEKEIDKTLLDLGENSFIGEKVALYYTYRHRKSSIAGGDIEDMDFDEEVPNTGFLSKYREEDGRIPTPAIEIGAASFRYKHVSVANISRVTSVYGEHMRALFGCGEGFIQLGYDFASLEARVMSHYIKKYPKGIEIGEALNAEKPNDIHTINAGKLGISRGDAKSFTYACVPMDTKVLTDKGWKNYSELSVGDTVMSYNPQKDVVEPDTVLEKHFYKDAEVIKLHNSSHDLLSTENHRWYGWKRVSPKNKPKYIKNCFFTTKEVNQEHCFLTSAPYVGGDSKITPDEALLLGLVLSDGSIAWSKRSERTSASNGKRKQADLHLTQDPKKFLKEITECLDRLGLCYNVYEHPNRDVRTIRVCGEDSRSFLDRVVGQRLNKNDMDWQEWVLSLSYASLQSFVEGFFLGDGHAKERLKNPRTFLITQNEGPLLDAIELACLLLGDGCMVKNFKSFNGKNNCWVLRKKPRRHITAQEIKKESVGKQDVFCITTNNSTFIIKQEKYIGITGNSIYGAAPAKLTKMLKVDNERGKEIFDEFWQAMLPLKMLKDNLLLHWEKNDKKYIRGIDGRKIRARSPHSLLNALFQSAGVICAKYTTIFLMEELEREGLNTDVFAGEPDVCSMIEYHDEAQLLLNRGLVKFKTFETEQEAKDFISLWQGEQLSAVAHGKKYYVALPNPVSRAIKRATDRVEKLLNLQFELGIEWIVGANWAQCH